MLAADLFGLGSLQWFSGQPATEPSVAEALEEAAGVAHTETPRSVRPLIGDQEVSQGSLPVALVAIQRVLPPLRASARTASTVSGDAGLRLSVRDGALPAILLVILSPDQAFPLQYKQRLGNCALGRAEVLCHAARRIAVAVRAGQVEQGREMDRL